MNSNNTNASLLNIEALASEYEASIENRRALEREMMFGSWDGARYRIAFDRERMASDMYAAGCREVGVHLTSNAYSLFRTRA